MMNNGSSVMVSNSGIYYPDRYLGNANPVGNVLKPTREMAPLEAGANPRVQHPRLNTNPWSTSYAVKRTEPRQNKKRSRQRKGYNGQ